MSLIDIWDSIVSWFEGVFDWFSDISLPDLDGLLEGLHLETGPLVIAFFATFLSAIMFLDGFLIVTGSIDTIPLHFRIIMIVLIGPISYFVTKMMLNK
jgi:hypothetical protein